MRALVTGACGFVGGHLVRHLVSSGDTVLGTTVGAPIANLPGETLTLDVTDGRAVKKAIADFRPEVIYHLAGLSFVPDAEQNFDSALRINVGSVHNVYRAAHESGSDIKVIFISSAEVYGKVPFSALPIQEEHPIHPGNNYSLSKAMAEMIAGRYSQLGRISSVIFRPFNHIGAGQSDRFVASSFARQLVQIKRGEAPPVIFVGNLTPRRDFSDVTDIVRAYRLGAEKGEGIYNLSSGVGVSIREILDILIEISGVKVSIKEDPARFRPVEVPELYGSSEKAKRELGWAPERSLRQALESVYEFWLGVGV